MARGRRPRDAYDIANDPLRDLVGPAFDPLPVPDPVAQPRLEDRRRAHPEVEPFPTERSGQRARVVPAPVSKTYDFTRSRSRAFNQAAFQVPGQVAICIRRKQRKEVLHAKGFAGGKVRGPRRGPFSHIHCRRK